MRELNAETQALLQAGLGDRSLVDPRPARIRDAVTQVALDVDGCGGGFDDFLELMTRRANYLGIQLATTGSGRKWASFADLREALDSIWRTRHQSRPHAV